MQQHNKKNAQKDAQEKKFKMLNKDLGEIFEENGQKKVFFFLSWTRKEV